MVLDLCHSWGREPGWFYNKPRGEQVTLIGWWRARAPKEPTKPTRRGPKPSRAAEALARQVAEKRRKLREGVSAQSEEAEDFWLTGG